MLRILVPAAVSLAVAGALVSAQIERLTLDQMVARAD
jgi:hypothetical protein